MPLSDYWNGPAHRQRADDLEGQLKDLQSRHAELEEFTRKVGAMEALEVQALIEQEKVQLANVRQEAHGVGREVAALAKRSSELKAETGLGRSVASRKFCAL